MSTPPALPPPRKGGLLILGIAIGAVVALMMVILFLGLVWLGFSYFRGQSSPPQVIPLAAPPASPPLTDPLAAPPPGPRRPPTVRASPPGNFERTERVERMVDLAPEPRSPLEPAPGSIAPVFHLRSATQNLLDGKPFILETPGAEIRAADGYLIVSDSEELRIPGPISISVWFNARTTNRPMTLCSRALNGPPWQYPFSSWLLRINDPIHLEGSLTGEGGYAPATWITQPVRPGKWFHAVFTYDGRIKKLYLNGGRAAKILSGAINHRSPNRYAPGRSVLIGADESESPVGEIFDGAIDDLRIFNRALPEEEILEMYARPPFAREGGAGDRL